MHPDPYTAIQNALQFYNVDEIVISTFPDERSGWMRSDLDRARAGLDHASPSSTWWSARAKREGASA